MKNLKLSAFERAGLSNREMKQIQGGEGRKCVCGCLYENKGGSSFKYNGYANYNIGDKGGYTNTEEHKLVCDLLHSEGDVLIDYYG